MFRRAIAFPIILFLISANFMDTCKAQTFQYSRGWTNGKRSPEVIDDQIGLQQQREINLSDNIEQILLERCMRETWNELKKAPILASRLTPSLRSANSNNNLDNSNNNLFGSHHQSNDEQFD